MPIEREDWGPPVSGAGGRETPGNALVPAATEQQGSEPPTFTADDLALVTPLDSLDAEDVARYRKLLKDGIFDADGLARHYGLTPEEMEALTKPAPKAPSRASLEAELAEIAEFRRKDRRAYFRDEKMQARERELIAAREQIEAQPKTARREPSADATANLEAINKELADIDRLRRQDARRYRRDEALQQRELALIEAREQAKEAVRNAEAVQATVDAILEEVDDPEAFQARFDALPERARATIAQELALPPESPARVASQADLDRFATVPEQQELLVEWGRNAPRKLATVRARMERLLSAGEAAGRWFDALPTSQAKAVLRAMAG